MSKKQVQIVTPYIIRQYFNKNGYFNKMLKGEFTTRVGWKKHHAPIDEPICTYSQIVYYYDNTRRLVAIVHQYLRPDGTIGASGKPDPKRIYLKNKTIAVKSYS